MAKNTAKHIAGLFLAAIVSLAAGCGGGDDNSSSDPDVPQNPQDPGNPDPGGSSAGTWDSSKWDDANVVWAE